MNDMVYLSNIQHYVLGTVLGVECCIGSSHGAGRPHEDEDSFLPLSFLETHGTGLSSSFTSSLSYPLKFSSSYASHNLLWEVIYFFFHSWCHFRSYIWVDGP